MLELLAYLRANGFKTYIVSGGGIEFMRTLTEHAYGVPPEQVVGSSIKIRFEIRDGKAVLVRLPEIDFIDDKAGKPVGINTFIGRRPIAAFGNSDGDLQMLEWVSSVPGRRFGLIVRHDDAEREYAYDRESHVGRLDKAKRGRQNRAGRGGRRPQLHRRPQGLLFRWDALCRGAQAELRIFYKHVLCTHAG